MKHAGETGIIGLGKFGLQFGTALAGLGGKCVGVDVAPARVQLAREVLTQAWEADATDKTALAQLHFAGLETVVISAGDNLETSILVALNLLELGVRNIIVKAATPLHAKVLRRMGVRRVIQPEIDAATQLAHALDNPGLLDLLPIGKGVALQEVTVERLAGKSLRELSLRRENHVLVAGVQERGEREYRFVPDPDRPLHAGDKLLVIGYRDAVAALAARA